MTSKIIRVLLLLMVTLSACSRPGGEKSPAANERAKETRVLVRTVAPLRGKLASRLEITGVVQAYERADIFPRLEGSVIKIHKVEGDSVEVNDILVELNAEEHVIDRRTRELAVEQALLAVKQAELSKREMDKQVEARRTTFERETKMRDRSRDQRSQDVITDQDLELAEYNFAKALSDKEAAEIAALKAAEDLNVAHSRAREAESNLQAARLRCEWMTLRATVAGRITRRNLKVGQKATPGVAAYSIADFDSLVVSPAIPQKELRHLSLGLDVRLVSSAFADTSFRGRVEYIAPEVDTQSGTIEVRIRIDKSLPGLLPGMFVSGHIITAEREHLLLIPKKAILFERDRPYIYVIRKEDGDLRAAKLYVDRGLEDDSQMEYVPPLGRTSEITDETRIVLVGMDRLNDGALVDVLGVQESSASSGAESRPAAEK